MSHNEIGLINSPKNNTDDDKSLHSWLNQKEEYFAISG